MIKNIKWIVFASLVVTACSYDDGIPAPEAELPPIVAGEADFSRYVALGNSLTAGFSDNALFKAGQANAFSKLLADQFALAGGGLFTYPETNDNVGGLTLAGNMIQGPRLIFNGTAPVPLPGGVPTTDVTNILTGPFNNMGVPGAKSFHLAAQGYGSLAVLAQGGPANPYFVRFASSPSASIIGDAVAQNPTFFTLWIGNNDVLSYATSGGIGVNQLDNTNPATYGGNDITNPDVFANVYQGLVDALTNNGAKGAVANIPYVDSAPYFTTVPHNPITAAGLGAGLLPQGTPAQQLAAGTAAINQLNAQLLGPLNQILTALGQSDRINLLSTTESNPLLIVDENLTNLGPQISAIASSSGVPQLVALAPFLGATYGQARHATDSDLVCLPTRSVIGTAAGSPVADLNAFGVSFPLQDQHVLTADEVLQIRVATDAFNNTIRTVAEAKNLAFIDVNVILNQLANGGIRFDNFHMTDAFVRGGAFSLDGIHLTARANAYIANQFAKAINAKYGSTLRMYKPQQFPISYPTNLN